MKSHPWGVTTLLAAVLVATAFLSLLLGRYPMSLSEVLGALSSGFTGSERDAHSAAETVLFNVRLPRIIVATFVGAALAASGAAYQGIFKNPMVSPDLLGASAGASFGVALGIMLGFPMIGIQLAAFATGLLAVGITVAISARLARDQDSILVMVLSGIVVGSIFMSFVTLIKSVADPYSKLPAITFWLMGSLSGVTSADVGLLVLPMVIGIVPLFLLRWRMNVLSLGDEEALALGINTTRLRLIVVASSTLMIAASVSVSGVVGWVGLVIPHFARLLVGPDYRALLPASLLIGGTYLLLVDDVARSATATEIPLGVLTSLIGAPFFVYLLARVKRGWWA
ncbi:iron ABC transporter permease [candidate division BRC1 bacterium HGW-BRC1-1]|jgi:iron complex transport system permease protein|nr:MAG: iron ABC transporter permease [candidate division BRC1 bacterium HGW-BRC1-1]